MEFLFGGGLEVALSGGRGRESTSGFVTERILLVEGARAAATCVCHRDDFGAVPSFDLLECAILLQDASQDLRVNVNATEIDAILAAVDVRAKAEGDEIRHNTSFAARDFTDFILSGFVLSGLAKAVGVLLSLDEVILQKSENFARAQPQTQT